MIIANAKGVFCWALTWPDYFGYNYQRQASIGLSSQRLLEAFIKNFKNVNIQRTEVLLCYSN